MRRPWILILCFAGCLLAAAGLWRLCLHSDSTAFLPGYDGAEWIVDDAPAMNVARPAIAVTTVFKKMFVLNAVTGEPRLEIRAFRSVSVNINGQEIHLNGEPQHWKTIQSADVGGQLKAGTNEIIVSVTNNFGPPALWLQLTTQNISIGSDASWIASPVDSHWLPVRLAAQSPAAPEWSPVNGGIRMGDALQRNWKPLTLALVVALMAVLLASRRLKCPSVHPEKNIQLLLMAVLAVRLALWLNDVAALPPATGFDAEEHTDYIQFIQQHHIVTIPSDVRPILEETPPFMRATTFASMDTPGPFEQHATEAYFNVTLPDPSMTPAQVESFMHSFNVGTVISTAVHEAYPGHYIQFLWVPTAPSRVRKLLGAASNAEGWAHYCEQMMLDEGYGQPGAGAANERESKFLRLGQLQDALLRNARFIVGIQMHTGHMTMPEAIAFFEREGYQSHETAIVETRRGTSDPTYLYYTLGKLEILKLRDDLRKKQGAAFSLQKFHDDFLRQGFPPIKIVRAAMLGDDSPTL